MKFAFIQGGAYEKISVHFIAGALRDAGIEYAVFIEELESDFYGAVKAYQPDFIAHSLYIGEEDFAFESLRRLKEILPDVKTLVGGAFTVIFPEVVSRPEIDFVLRGDAEVTLPSFLRQYSVDWDPSVIPGISFKKNDGTVFENGKGELVDVKAIPKPDRDVYYKYPELRGASTKQFIASRGCPYKCTYCYNAELAGFFSKPYWRLRNIPEVLEEIRYVKERYGLQWVAFQDASLNANKKWLREFLGQYQAAGLPEFVCNMHAGNVDEPLIRLLKQAGCNRITFGVQSGNPRVRNTIAKRWETNEQIIAACRLCKDFGIRYNVDVIYGWPSETIDEAWDTVRLCRELDAETCSANILQFYPGVKVSRFALENGYIDKVPEISDLKLLDFKGSILRSPQKKIFINLNSLSSFIIKFPKLEWFFKVLLRLPPNRFFHLVKDFYILKRSIKYRSGQSVWAVIREYFVNHWH